MPKSKLTANSKKSNPQKNTRTKRASKMDATEPTLKTLEHIPIPYYSKFWYWLIGFAVTALIILLLSTTLVLVMVGQPKDSAKTANLNTNSAPQPITGVAPLTGQPVQSEIVNRRPWAVVVENLASIRPQAGLSYADVVFEAPAEGGVTRFLAIFQSRMPATVGPIRSAREYFNGWARGFKALYSHSGGSPEALAQLNKGYGALQNIDEFANAAAYERITGKAPHNLFTTNERFLNYVQSRAWSTETQVTALSYGALPGDTPAVEITIPYVPTDYSVRYIYVSSEQGYQRTLNTGIQTDKVTGAPITVQNAVVMFTDVSEIPGDEAGRLTVRTTGTGDIYLFRNGKKFDGRWMRKTQDDNLTFIDTTGAPLLLSPGNTWISIKDSDRKSSVKISSKASGLK